LAYSYQKDNGPSVGAKVLEIISKDQPVVEAGEIIEAYAKDYTSQLQCCVDAAHKARGSDFHVVVFHKKEVWAMNVLRNFFVHRKTCPDIKQMWTEYPNHGHTIYHFKGDNFKIVRSLPSRQEASGILRNWDLYHPDLVEWCRVALKEMVPKLLSAQIPFKSKA